MAADDIVVEDDMELPGGKYQAVDDREPGNTNM